MPLKGKDSTISKKSNNKIQKTKTKPNAKHSSNNQHVSRSKSKAKATKIKLDKLNADVTEFNEVSQLLAETSAIPKDKRKDANEDNLKVLKSIKEDYVKDKEKKKKDELANEEIKKQMQLLTDIGL
ncbi:hypothetical protein CANMA_001008 [Candida margitis]|uniref:uncharacterized protein n=1 Tax=Candida margitis TaxID=1775924 RepID=UPI002226DFFD|nr:uncharacterized protein CANMA_001008 [Candida margitis]KAI5969968.1 hypothetical protein CANMA_001008 [Candida margitis]